MSQAATNMIINQVSKCPSGAISIAVKESVDKKEEG